jgi:hypothetical protein
VLVRIPGPHLLRRHTSAHARALGREAHHHIIS